MDFDSETTRARLMLLKEDLKDINEQGKKAIEDNNEVFLFIGMMTSISDLNTAYDSTFQELYEARDEIGLLYLNQQDKDNRASAKKYFHECHGYMARINERKAREQPSTSQINNSISSSSSPFKTKLPDLGLPRFSGERTQWPRFKDTFTSRIIETERLKDVDKFHFLERCLEGSAASVISLIPITEANFQVAWKTLVDNYDNPRLLAATYLDNLLEVKKLTTKPNADTLLKLINEISENLAAFQLLNIPNRLEFIYFFLASRCLDSYTKEQFELHNQTEFPNYNDFIKYLRTRCTAAELAAGVKINKVDHKPDPNKGKLNRKFWQPRSSNGKVSLMTDAGASGSNTYKSANADSSYKRNQLSCFVCKGPHLLPNCVKFSNESLAGRQRLLRTWKGCRNCLFYGHVSADCTSKYSCKFCKGHHHSLLHGINVNQKFQKSPVKPTEDIPSPPNPDGDKKDASLNTVDSGQLEVMFGTVVCRIVASDGSMHPIRVVLDCCSNSSYITTSFAERLGLNIQPHSSGVWGMGETLIPGVTGRSHCTLLPSNSDGPEFSTSILVRDTITFSSPGFNSNESFWTSYFDYELADPQFWVSRPIDFLISCDMFAEILTGEMIRIRPDMPILIGTFFGFSVIGRVKDIAEASTSRRRVLCSTATLSDDSLQNQVCRFWELEEPAAATRLDPEEEQCEAMFRSTHYRLPTGRYVVRLPFKAGHPPDMNYTKNLALRRLEHLETRLQRNSLLRLKYNEFMLEYLELGHMERALQPGKVFIPHHCVTKGEGENMKIRVVFDAAARTSSGSFNDYLLVGPKLQNNMVDIALNFRQYQFVFTTDIVKMFRQVLIHEEDRPYLHILWRFDPAQAVEEFELKTVTYGTAPAPYLAIRALRQVAEDEGAAFPDAATAIKSDSYVDDLATGAKTLLAALDLQQQVIALLAKGEFSLGKWTANHPKLLDVCKQPEDISSEPVSLSASDDTTVKILGLQWDPQSDCFSFKIVPPDDKCTKRTVLSSVTKIYDPLGYIGPTVVIAKMIIQESWKLKLSWDQEFPLSLKDSWSDFVEHLPILSDVRIPRWIVPNNGPYQILIFADASERVYCAAAYLRSSTGEGAQSHLIFAKTRLAPVKTLTIPRLELCAALLAARVWQSLTEFCQRLPSMPSAYFFSDSMIVLAWLQTPTYKLKTFVANRIEKINALTSCGPWQHVASCDNPSDLGSRGVPPEELLNNSLWFHGPDWARLEPPDWPVISSPIRVPVPELKEHSNVSLVTSTKSSVIIDWFNRFSKFRTLIRSLAFILRYMNYLLKKSVETGPLTTEELEYSKKCAIKLVQWQFYFNGKEPSSNTSMPKELLNLKPFCDETGVLMVGGRLKHSDLDWNQKHPYILPGKTHLARLIVEHYHIGLCHCGPNLLLANIRGVYWITGARNLVRRVTRNCVPCRKFDAQPIQPPMGDIPAVRFRAGRVFAHVGVDFAGPFYIRESLRRKAQTTKAYMCLFVCLSTKALHLELVSSLSTEAFCAALDRFIGRRGVPEQILSDNGTNFVGASNELTELYAWYVSSSIQKEFQYYATEKSIKWTFTPPHAPFFGGIWESGVKSVKRLLRSVYGENHLTFEELATWLIKIEAILNSRPLCPLSNDPADLDFLTPGHFLIGCSLLSVPEKSLLNTKENRLSRWKLVCQKAEHFWHRWRTEYLYTLQERTKWHHPSYNLQVGNLVIIKEDFAPRLRWPVGRIVEVFPGSDGIVRVASVQSHQSVLKRPAAKLIPLLPEPESRTLTPQSTGHDF